MENAPVFSLIHATWHREGGPVPVMDAWLDAASSPESIEYIFALDSDDHVALKQTRAFSRVVGEPMEESSAVRNWNAAARESTGDLIFVVADDFFPGKNWDLEILDCIEAFSPRSQPFVVKIRDSAAQSTSWLQHPMVSRAYFNRFGLFSERYFHLGCDSDLSLRATRTVPILDCREVSFEHRHPGAGFAEVSKSHVKGYQSIRGARAQVVKDHSLFARFVGVGLSPRALFPLIARFPSLSKPIQFVTGLREIRVNAKREFRKAWKSQQVRPLRRVIRETKRALRLGRG